MRTACQVGNPYGQMAVLGAINPRPFVKNSRPGMRQAERCRIWVFASPAIHQAGLLLWVALGLGMPAAARRKRLEAQRRLTVWAGQTYDARAHDDCPEVRGGRGLWRMRRMGGV